MLDEELVKAYNQGRLTGRKERLCQAPFSNIYFNMYGQGAPCWLTLEHAPAYPRHSIREMWFGERYEGFRARIAANDLSGPCHVCERNIRNRVFTNTLARAYDNDHQPSSYPSIMEFELSNTCNLECIMCKGTLSSTIRRDRDALPPMRAPYDDAFVDQLEEFIPHLREARFNGGEPFLQKICWDIWERIQKLNPAVEITVATNATTLSDRIKRMLEGGRFRVNVSLDSLRKETYESIRVNATFERTLENLKWFGEYCRARGTRFCIMVNPMRMNWREMPEYVRFCAKNGYFLWFNTIWRPYHLAIWTLESARIERIRAELSRELQALTETPVPGPTFQACLGILRNFVEDQLRAWASEQAVRERDGRDHRTLLGQLTGARDAFRKRLSERLGADPRLPDFLRKLEGLEQRVSRNVPAESYYGLLLRQPVEMVIEDLRTRSAEELVEWVYKHDGYY
jgi:MoaA/NifB/PqqE/SkfB family radical SAM enzyme